MAEKALLKYCDWKINIHSPSDFIDMIYNNLLIKYKNNNDIIEKINKYKDINITLLEFAICEYNIFSKYNQIIICLSSCLISLKQTIDDEENNQCIEIQNELKEIVDNIINKINFDKNLIDSCSILILNNLEKDDEQNDEKVDKENQNEIKEKENENILSINNQLEITRNDSNVSFCEAINNYIYEKSFDNNEKENYLNNFWKISPISNISNEDSLNVENDDNLFFFDDKELNKNKNKYDVLDNGDLLLLKRKRNKN